MLRLSLALDLFNTVMADFTGNFPLLDRLKLAIPIKSLTLTRLLAYRGRLRTATMMCSLVFDSFTDALLIITV